MRARAPHKPAAAISSALYSQPHQELGTTTAGAEGTLLRFAAEVAGQPFVKMALLAAALLLGR